MEDWISVILAALGGGGITAIGTWLLNWKKAKPDIAKIYEEMATNQAKQIEELRQRLNEQDEKLQKQDQKIQEQDLKIERQGRVIINLRNCLKKWEKGIRMLLEQIEAKELTPVWTPKVVDLLSFEEKE